MRQRIVVIGAGFGGLSAAALLARQGHDVTLVEKNGQPGGRAMVWEKDGFRFDMGPSWYLMPEIFEAFFESCGSSVEERLELRRLDPAYRIYYGRGEGAPVDVPADLDAAYALFDGFEPEGGAKLQAYLERSAEQYRIAMEDFVDRPYRSVADFADRRLMVEGLRLGMFSNLDRYVSKRFDSDRAKKILEYSMVFLGGAPSNTPALYNIMSHVDLTLGVWYPMGGMSAVVSAIEDIARESGATLRYGEPVREIVVREGRAAGVRTDEGLIEADQVVCGADYQHAETALLAPEHRQYDDRYWNSRVVAPSAYLLYLGVRGRVESLDHHTLFLQPDWEQHFEQIFDRPVWPDRPSYYVCAPSKTDPGVAPEGMENLFVLVPIAPGLEDEPESRAALREIVLSDLEAQTGEPIRDRIVLERGYAHRDFIADHNAFQGTALGLAHTLRQTAAFRPRYRSAKVDGLYFTGQYVHPGIGVPMTLIASQIVARELQP